MNPHCCVCTKCGAFAHDHTYCFDHMKLGMMGTLKVNIPEEEKETPNDQLHMGIQMILNELTQIKMMIKSATETHSVFPVKVESTKTIRKRKK